MNSRSTRCIALCAVLGALVSSAAIGVGTGGTGLRLAYVRGMLAASGGHVAIGGVAFSTGMASVTINGERGRSVGDLRDGMVAGVDGEVDRTGAQGVAHDISVNRLVKGKVWRVGTGGTGLKVANLSVVPAAGVVLAGVASLADVASGDWLDVYGYTDGISGTVQATRIERIAPAGASEVHGTITALDATTALVNGVTVDYRNAVLAGFDPVPVVGDRVTVIGGQTPAGMTADYLIADDDAVREDAAEAEVEDAVEAVIATGRFVVAGLEVDATHATYAGGTAADIAAGRVVHVTGSIVAGVLVASDVEFDDGAGEAEVEGTISAVTTATTFLVHGVSVDATSARLKGGSLADIAVGRRVEVSGTRGKDKVIKAARVEFDDAGSPGKTPGGGADASLEGVVRALAGPGQFWVGATLVDASAAQVKGGTLSSLKPGVRVEVTGTLASGMLIARRLQIGG